MKYPNHVPGLHEKLFHPAAGCVLPPNKTRAFRILSFEKFSAYIINNPFLNVTHNVGDKSLVPYDLLN